jgi:DNA mismatch repair protein MutL
MYAFVQAAVKHALAQFSIAPSLDFTLNADIQNLDAITQPFTDEKKQIVSSGNLYKGFTQKHQAHFIESDDKNELKNWKEFFKPSTVEKDIPPEEKLEFGKTSSFNFQFSTLLQIFNTYIITSTENGLIIVHQQLAHERILYDKYSIAASNNKSVSQKSLFPVTVELSAADAILLNELLHDLKIIGYLIEPFGNNSFIVQATPADISEGNEKQSIELLIEQFKHFSSDVKFSKREKLIRSLSRQQAVKAGQSLSPEEMKILLNDLFNCSTPNITPTGSPTFIEFKEEYIDRLFER